MALIYSVQSSNNKDVYLSYELYRHSQGVLYGCTVTEVYATGKGFVDSKENLPNADDIECMIDPTFVKPILSNLKDTNFVYDSTLTREEKEKIEWQWEQQGSNWLENSQDWALEQTTLIIPGPFTVNEVDKVTRTVLKYNIYLEQLIFS